MVRVSDDIGGSSSRRRGGVVAKSAVVTEGTIYQPLRSGRI